MNVMSIELPSIPSSSSFKPDQRVPSSHPSVLKALTRLSRPSLLSCCQDWLDPRNGDEAGPYLLAEADGRRDEGDVYPPFSSLDQIRQFYEELEQDVKGSKRELVERIMEGDWRHGLSLYQMATLDMKYLYAHPTAHTWDAFRIAQLKSANSHNQDSALPRFIPATFPTNLQNEFPPDVKLYISLVRHDTLPLYILRIVFIDSPYTTSLAFSLKSDFASKTFYIVFPDASPYVYLSLKAPLHKVPTAVPGVGRMDHKYLRSLLLDAVPRALSQPRKRYKLTYSHLSAKNLTALCSMRGGGRTNAAGGGYGIYAEEDKTDTPLNIELPAAPAKREHEQETSGDEDARRRKAICRSRFGNSALLDDGKGIENFSTTLRNGQDTPEIRATFRGPHVFAGIRRLVELGVVDGERMPAWMTGEENVSIRD